ncbi:MAG: hypothetical protein C0490_16235 [Marivirga sp.]|nr:hypothetical protein [Marivirga sp.]
MIGSIASLDFSKELVTSEQNDMVDAIALGLNMLSEELNVQVVNKARLDEVNSKLEKFAYTTAHDLKSPLNSQYGLLQLLELSIGPGNADAQEYIDKLKLVNRRMKGLVEGILAYSVTHFRDVAKEPVDWHLLLREVMEVDSVLTSADVEIRGTLPVLPFNKTAATQIVRNLLDNAIKYCDKKRCKITIEAQPFETHYQFSFRDNGPGISHENQEKIFELFNQIEPSYKATSVGIGLATVKGVLDAAGERIWLESAIGEGASFIFTIAKKIQ